MTTSDDVIALFDYLNVINQSGDAITVNELGIVESINQLFKVELIKQLGIQGYLALLKRGAHTR